MSLRQKLFTAPSNLSDGSEFSIEDHVPQDHLLRSIDRFVDSSGIRQHLVPFYSNTGRPSIDPELLIRTGGDFRVSNYLLWQISYAEIIVLDEYWPDFDAQAMCDAVRVFASRSRRFGGLDRKDTDAQ